MLENKSIVEELWRGNVLPQEEEGRYHHLLQSHEATFIHYEILPFSFLLLLKYS